MGILLPNNQRQHRTSHIQQDVLPLTVFKVVVPVRLLAL